jgi:hypothetical protein
MVLICSWNRNRNFFNSRNRNRNHNFSKVRTGTGTGTGTVINSYGSTTLVKTSLSSFYVSIVFFSNGNGSTDNIFTSFADLIEALFHMAKWQKLLSRTWQSFGLENFGKCHIINDEVYLRFYFLFILWAGLQYLG